MKYHDYTYNTGNHTVHDTDVCLAAGKIRILEQLILHQRGNIPWMPNITYLFTEHGDTAILSVHQAAWPIWYSTFFNNAAGAEGAMKHSHEIAECINDFARSVPWLADMGPIVPRRDLALAAPGLITVLDPFGLLTAGREAVFALAGFARDMAGVWLRQELSIRTNRAGDQR